MTTQPVALTDFVTTWGSSTSVAPALSCAELDALLGLFRAAGKPDTAAAWIGAHAERGDCEGHDTTVAPVTVQGDDGPPPGTEFPFSISDVARAVARRLGDGWSVETGSWGMTATVTSPDGIDFKFYVDEEDDLIVEYWPGDDFPESPELAADFRECDNGIYLELARHSDGLDHLAGRYAEAIRAVTGY
ncbi:hypothetical protein ACFWH1_28120 [Streptomyces sp. NPDC127037]|uniref:hypothetical protein n=1 Tax=Streptomyces sp. NPDC127037 TaxID=3347113 RepID=UPI0036671812